MKRSAKRNKPKEKKVDENKTMKVKMRFSFDGVNSPLIDC